MIFDLSEMRAFKEDEREITQLIDTAIMLDMDDTLTKSRTALADLHLRHERYVRDYHAGQIGEYEI